MTGSSGESDQSRAFLVQRFARYVSPLMFGRVVSYLQFPTLDGVLVQYRKPKPIPLTEFVPWTTAYFQTQEIRDRFLHVAATLPASDVEVEPMLDEIRGALVRWRPGQFLGLNDIAYAHGGRIIVTAGRGHLSDHPPAASSSRGGRGSSRPGAISYTRYTR